MRRENPHIEEELQQPQVRRAVHPLREDWDRAVYAAVFGYFPEENQNHPQVGEAARRMNFSAGGENLNAYLRPLFEFYQERFYAIHRQARDSIRNSDFDTLPFQVLSEADKTHINEIVEEIQQLEEALARLIAEGIPEEEKRRVRTAYRDDYNQRLRPLFANLQLQYNLYNRQPFFDAEALAELNDVELGTIVGGIGGTFNFLCRTLTNLFTFFGGREFANQEQGGAAPDVPPFQPSYNAANRVTIYIWKRDSLRGIVGHASLQTYGNDGVYASFWPGVGASFYPWEEGFGQYTLNGVTGYLMPSLERDIAQEDGREPDVVINLYSLNSQAIVHHYHQFTEADQNWSLLGGLWITQSENVTNCSALVLELLEQAGIRRLPLGNFFLQNLVSETITGGITGTAQILTALNVNNHQVDQAFQANPDLMLGTVATIGAAQTLANNALELASITPDYIASLATSARKEEMRVLDDMERELTRVRREIVQWHCRALRGIERDIERRKREIERGLSELREQLDLYVNHYLRESQFIDNFIQAAHERNVLNTDEHRLVAALFLINIFHVYYDADAIECHRMARIEPPTTTFNWCRLSALSFSLQYLPLNLLNINPVNTASTYSSNQVASGTQTTTSNSESKNVEAKGCSIS